MNTIILAGGRGSRLGILAKNIQKAVLLFDGKPLIAHFLDKILSEEITGIVTVLTGYRGQDIHNVLINYYPEHLNSGRLQVINLPTIYGTLNRLAAAIPYIDVSKGYCVYGIDGLVPMAVLKTFWLFIEENKEYSALLLSPRLEIAPTHALACLDRNTVIKYLTPKEFGGKENSYQACFSDVNIRYFSPESIPVLRGMGVSNERAIVEFIKTLLELKQKILGYVFSDEWKHFSAPYDFQLVRPH